ncbi:MAG: DUF4846 domain-containing protein [Candidatus Aminicenantes bacterium]|nr:DUF4846 domain-containing protein [Candidatus Aminicenantes bacterium]
MSAEAGGATLPRLDPEGTTVETRFPAPEGTVREDVEEASFAAYLRRLPLKPHGSKVRIHDGREKEPAGIYLAVVDLSLGARDLQQCADAVIRLRAEYLFAQGRYDEIRFRFARDGRPRPYLVFAGEDRSTGRFLAYLDWVFAYANTASLAAETSAVENVRDMRIGDLFVKPGRPYGHAVIVVDMVRGKEDGKALFLLAQSYMPAQDIQVLLNPSDPEQGPWYAAESGAPLVTPEWTFSVSDLRRFR